MSGEAPAVLAVTGLSVALPWGAERANAVEAVDLTVRAGEILCVVGESGSGKSVIAQTVMGIAPAELAVSSGRILLEGQDLLALAPRRRRSLCGSRVSMIFQEPSAALDPVMRIGRQIEEGLRKHTRMTRAQRRGRVLSLMEQVRLPDPERLLDLYPHQLSGGQCQRVMIAAALALEPALLIADEPTTALDVVTQAEILRLIRSICETRGTAVMLITHDFGVVAEMADSVAVMRRGKVVEAGPARQVLEAPREDYTRMLLAAVPKMEPRRPRQAGIVPADAAGRPALLRLAGVSKRYSGGNIFSRAAARPALNPTSLSVQAGETLGIVGESGSGKSTLARCISRLVEPSAGRIWLGDSEIAGARGEALRLQRRRVQIVFQDPNRSLNPRRTVGDSIVECPLNFGVPAAEAWARAAELMQLVGLDPSALRRYPHAFSGGQRQRVAIARALAIGPELLIADEAVSALDVSVQAQIIALLTDIQAKLGLTMLFITHDLRVASRLCDRVAVMHRGDVVELGPTSEVFTAPRHDYTRRLLDALPGRTRPTAPDGGS